MGCCQKPVLDLFLKPFVDELQKLHETGFQCTPPGYDDPVTIRVHTILAPVDSVERCAAQKFHQYNGSYGCTFCLHPGHAYTKVSKMNQEQQNSI